MTALTSPTVKVRVPKQTPEEKQKVYDYVTFRERWDCAAWRIDPSITPVECYGRRERHHAGNKIGTRRITDPRHVVLLCKWHHKNWAPTHSRLILQYLKDVEDAREKARHDAEEDGGSA